MNLYTLFDIPLQRTPHKVALHFVPAEGPAQPWSFGELHAAAAALAAGLQAWGLVKGDRVAFYLSSRPEFVIAYLAVIRLGGVVVPINLRYRRGEIGHIVADAEPRLLITEAGHEAVLAEVDLAGSGVEALILAEELGRWQADPVPPPLVSGDDLALIIYTSGTTGRSKGAMISHQNVLATMTGLLSAWAWQAEDLLLLTLPLFHVHGLVVGLHCALAAGATVRLHPGFDTERVVAELLGGEPTLFFAVPTIYLRLVEALGRLPMPVQFDRMRLFCSGSAPLAIETFTAFRALTGHTILERYGMTETGMNLSNPYAGSRVAGSVGLPLPGVSMRIVDHEYRDLVPGEAGELLVHGSHVFSGYWRAAEKSAACFSHDALGRRWFHTGDLARQEPATGYVTLLGRRHELIISGGFNIYPREIEETLQALPGVVEAAVIGVPHAQWGEVPVAYVVLAHAVDADQLTAHCRAQLAAFKLPCAFHTLPELPRNAMGKIQKHLLPRAISQ